MSDGLEQEARNEATFRYMNEWTEEDVDARLGLERPIDTYLCECSDPGCAEPIRLTRGEYEAIRVEPTRFAIRPNHENPEVDRVVQENPRYATVAKFYAPAARLARETDPRR